MAPVCRFYLQGTCRFGERCKYEHPPSRDLPNENRFAALQSPDNSNSRSYHNVYQGRDNNNGYQSGGGRPPLQRSSAVGNSQDAPVAPTLPYSLDKATIITDLTTERPQWILSAYGPGRNAPEQIFGGEMREQSFEEMRLVHYMGLASGNAQQAISKADQMYTVAEQQMQAVLNNVDGAMDFVINAERTHPNRIDVCRNSGASTAGSQPNPFGSQQSGPTRNPFGAPSQPASQPASLPAFGASSAPSGAFGQPTALGQKSNPFGAPTFGAPSQPVGSFGQPSALGQKSNPFGAPSVAAPATTSAPFSSFSQPANPFNQQPATSNPFGAPSQPAQVNPFGQQQPATSNPFGAPSQPAQANPFGQPSGQSQAPWAQNTPTQSNPFSNTSPSPFGVPSPAKNPFGTQPTNSSQPNPFGAPSLPAQATPFGNPSLNQANPLERPSSSGTGAMNGNTASELDPQTGRLRTWHGKPVVYRNEIPGFEKTGAWKNGRRDMIWERIWFPTGPPRENLDTEMIDKSLYEDPKLKETYMAARETGSFPGGIMPLIPPMREWCEWDF